MKLCQIRSAARSKIVFDNSTPAKNVLGLDTFSFKLN